MALNSNNCSSNKLVAEQQEDVEEIKVIENTIETNIETDREVDTGIPMDQDKNIENYLENSKCVGEVGGGLGFIKELEHSFNLDNSVESQDDFTRDLVATFSREKEIQKVSGKNADDVFLEPA